MGEILNEPLEDNGGGRRLFPFRSLSQVSVKVRGVSLSAEIFVSTSLVGIDRQTRILRTYGRNTELLLYRHSVRAFHTRPPSTPPAAVRPDGS